MKMIAMIAALLALAVDAAPPRLVGTRIQHPTNATEVLGVAMPPKWTEADWLKRQALIEEFKGQLEKLDETNGERWRRSLDEKQRRALKDQSASNEVAVVEAAAKLKRRQWELEAITNRMAWVKRAWHEKRRSEYEYHPGLKWMDSEIVKETVTRAERGKVELHILYTADGKRHRFDPDSITREIERQRIGNTLKEIVQ